MLIAYYMLIIMTKMHEKYVIKYERKLFQMPIYEFKCLKCQNLFELLVIHQDDKEEIKCPKCGAQDFERVISTTSYAMGDAGGGTDQPSVCSRVCSTGSCTTIDLPGHRR